jgi:hypothetical protein
MWQKQLQLLQDHPSAKTVLDHNILLLDIAGFVQIPGCPRKGTSDLRVNEYAAYSLRQLFANAAITASRVGA